MARDYKNCFAEPPKKSRRNEWVALLILAVVALGATALHLSHVTDKSLPHQTFAEWVAEIKTKWQHRSSILPSKPLTLAQKEAPQNQVRFDFYNELPNMKVGVPETVSASAKLVSTTPAQPAVPATTNQSGGPVAATTHYFVQIGTFKSSAEASQLRISLLLAGIEAEVVKKDTQGQPTYVVQQGPFASAGLAKSTQKRLLDKGFSTTVIAVKN